MDLQTEGEFGKRDIYGRALMFPIPLFDENNNYHIRLAELSIICHDKANNINLIYKRVGKQRLEVKKSLVREFEEIDNITSLIIPL